MKEKILTIMFILAAVVLFSISCKKDEMPAEIITDIEGNNYKTVKIGNQVWMAENLKTTRFSDGTDIPLTKDAIDWGNLTTPGYCWYNNDAESFRDTYGAIYNGYTVVTGKLCPDGWHVPEMKEWLTLREFLGDSVNGGGKLKESGTAHWLSPNKGADNNAGFTALPAGIRYFEGTFASMLSFTSMWSSTEIANDDEWYSALYFADAAFITDHRNKKHGFSVRCIKD